MANKYLYNGIELPDINTVWTDKETYPYAYIGQYNDGYRLVLGSSQIKMIVAEGTYNFSSANQYRNDLIFELINNEWSEYSPYWIKPIIIWSSVDILYNNVDGIEDGTLYLAASYPVPVSVLTARDLYRKINGKPTKLTLYKKLGGKLIPLDEHTKEVKT